MGMTYVTSVGPGLFRYAAPELFLPRTRGRTLPAVDVYSFGCIAYEVGGDRSLTYSRAPADFIYAGPLRPRAIP